MCGIAGYFGAGSIEQLHDMRVQLNHRGPDEWGVFCDEKQPVGFVHTRLSIIDLKGGTQPLYNADKSITVIFNGEIYNHQELRDKLVKKGYKLACHSDGEVISHLYEEYGIEFVHQLRGMFAIALWDESKQKLFLIRDRFGIKPLYYFQDDNSTYFASEFKALLPLCKHKEPDFQALNWYLTFRYIPGNLTGLENIYKLEPGHYLEVSKDGHKATHYWDISDTQLNETQDELKNIDTVHEGLKESIELRLMSDVPIGAFLSGGLDSSYIVGLMSEMNASPIETFSFGIGDGWHNESNFAELVSNYANTNHHALTGDCNDEEVLKKAIWHLDEPLGDTAIIPTYLLSKLTREYVTVSLMGEGADELLAGYDKYKVLKYSQALSSFTPSWIYKAFAPLAKGSEKAFRLLSSLASKKDFGDAYVKLASVFHEDEISKLATSSFKAKLDKTSSSSNLINNILKAVDGRPIMDKLMYIDIKTWLPNDVLLKADKMTMAHSLEGRVPFLDHIYAEKLFAITDKQKLSGLTEKAILRKAMKNHTPPEIQKRRKHGFTVPLEPWLAEENNIIRQVLSKESIENRGWFNYEYVQQLLSKPTSQEYTRRKIVALFFLELWARTFLDENNPQATH